MAMSQHLALSWYDATLEAGAVQSLDFFFVFEMASFNVIELVTSFLQ